MNELERLSLSYANTQLAYGVLSGISVLLLYRCKKAKKPMDTDAQEIQALKVIVAKYGARIENSRQIQPRRLARSPPQKRPGVMPLRKECKRFFFFLN